MDAERPRGVTRFFDGVEDPRIDRTKRHKLEDILMIALVAILGGAEGWTQVELFGKSNEITAIGALIATLELIRITKSFQACALWHSPPSAVPQT